MYRLHIDIPLNLSMEEACHISKEIMDKFINDILSKTDDIDQVNYRVGHDDDRQKSNYLDINENGHCSNKKTKVKL